MLNFLKSLASTSFATQAWVAERILTKCAQLAQLPEAQGRAPLRRARRCWSDGLRPGGISAQARAPGACPRFAAAAAAVSAARNRCAGAHVTRPGHPRAHRR